MAIGHSDAGPENPALIINAGGDGRRMGANKALLPTPPHARPLLEHMLTRLAPLAARPIIVVANDPAVARTVQTSLDVRYVTDAYPQGGALGGIATGLSYSPGWAWVLACDLPFVDPGLLQRLAAYAQPHAPVDVVLPRVDGRLQPLHALYHARALPSMIAFLQTGQRRALDFLAAARVREVDEADLDLPDGPFHSFYNANTPAEWQAARRRLLSRQP